MLEHLFPGAAHIQNWHPLVVHFPIAFLAGATLFYFAAWLSRRESLAWVGIWMLVVGLAGGAVAIFTGLRAREGVMLAPSVREHVLTPHMWFMIATAVSAALLVLWALLARPMPAKARGLFLAGLVVMCAVMAKGADYGGLMVFDYNGGGAACPQPIEYNPSGSPAM